MNLFLVILLALLLLACSAILFQRIIQPMQPSTGKTVISVIHITVSIIMLILFIASAGIPKSINNFINTGVTGIETQINEISPDYTNQVLDIEKVESLISDTKQMRSYLDSNGDVNFVLKMVGVNAYILYLESFRDNIEENLQIFEESGTPFTLHNIFEFLKERSQQPILKFAKVIQVLILILSALLLIASFIVCKGIEKGWFNSSDSPVYGEGI